MLSAIRTRTPKRACVYTQLGVCVCVFACAGARVHIDCGLAERWRGGRSLKVAAAAVALAEHQRHQSTVARHSRLLDNNASGGQRRRPTTTDSDDEHDRRRRGGEGYSDDDYHRGSSYATIVNGSVSRQWHRAQRVRR